MSSYVFSKELLRHSEKLDIRNRRPVSALLDGHSLSRHRGTGMQFKEFRHYEPGDDVRHIAWTVTARTGRATLKLYDKELERNTVLVADVSGSSLFGSLSQRKIDMYADVMALFGLSALRTGDRFGSLLFDDSPLDFLPPLRSREQLVRGIHHLLDQPLLGKKSDLRPSLRFLREKLKSPTMIFILSDFVLPSFELELAALSRKHEITLLQGYDDGERLLKADGVWEVCDPETGDFLLLDTSSQKVRLKIRRHYLETEEHLKDLSRKYRLGYLPLSVEDDYLQRIVYAFSHPLRLAA